MKRIVSIITVVLAIVCFVNFASADDTYTVDAKAKAKAEATATGNGGTGGSGGSIAEGAVVSNGGSATGGTLNINGGISPQGGTGAAAADAAAAAGDSQVGDVTNDGNSQTLTYEVPKPIQSISVGHAYPLNTVNKMSEGDLTPAVFTRNPYMIPGMKVVYSPDENMIPVGYPVFIDSPYSLLEESIVERALEENEIDPSIIFVTIYVREKNRVAKNNAKGLSVGIGKGGTDGFAIGAAAGFNWAEAWEEVDTVVTLNFYRLKDTVKTEAKAEVEVAPKVEAEIVECDTSDPESDCAKWLRQHQESSQKLLRQGYTPQKRVPLVTCPKNLK